MVLKKKRESNLLLLCWFVYVCAYIGKYSYSANKVAIISYYGVSNAEAGLIGTLFFFAYGSSQVLHGILCKHYNQKIVVPACLTVCATINILFACDLPFSVLKYLWLINGLVESVFWPCMILTLSNSLSHESLDKAVVTMSTTFALGMSLAYLFAWLFVSLLSFHFAFLTSGALLLVMAVMWIINYDKLVENSQRKIQPLEETQKQQTSQSKLTGLFLFEIIVLSAMAIVCNFVKDGLFSWTSVLLTQEFGLQENMSIILTLLVSLVGALGPFCVVFVHKVIKDFSTLATLFFVLAGVLFVILILLFELHAIPLVVVLFGAITLCTHAIINVITNMAPMYLRDVINAGLLSGLLNGVGYVGSSISEYGLGAFSDANGWFSVLYLLAISCVLPIILWIAQKIVRAVSSKKHSNENDNNMV